MTEPKVKTNKDGFIPGEPVDPESYNKIMAERRAKDPYLGEKLSKSVPRYKAPVSKEDVTIIAKARGNYE